MQAQSTVAALTVGDALQWGHGLRAVDTQLPGRHDHRHHVLSSNSSDSRGAFATGLVASSASVGPRLDYSSRALPPKAGGSPESLSGVAPQTRALDAKRRTGQAAFTQRHRVRRSPPPRSSTDQTRRH